MSLHPNGCGSETTISIPFDVCDSPDMWDCIFGEYFIQEFVLKKTGDIENTMQMNQNQQQKRGKIHTSRTCTSW
jgi:hypothetical protein